MVLKQTNANGNNNDDNNNDNSGDDDDDGNRDINAVHNYHHANNVNKISI